MWVRRILTGQQLCSSPVVATRLLSIRKAMRIPVHKYYAIGGQRVMREDDSNYYLLTDHLGSVVGIADGSGSFISEQRYMPYGLPRLDPGIDETDFGFTGQRALVGGGMIDYRARWYVDLLGIFAQVDTAIRSEGYRYVRNNPIRYLDPTGQFYCEATTECDPNQLHTYTQDQLLWSCPALVDSRVLPHHAAVA